MRIPLELLESLHQELPNVNDVKEPFICKHFTYGGKNFAINFYKVSDTGAEFWLFNPYNIIDVIG